MEPVNNFPGFSIWSNLH